MPVYSTAFEALSRGSFSIPELELGKFNIWDAHVQRLAAAISIPNLFKSRLEDTQCGQNNAHLKWIKYYVVNLLLESTKAVRDAAGLSIPPDMNEPYLVHNYIVDCNYTVCCNTKCNTI